MLNVLARNWWMLLLRGVAAVLFGILVIAFPIAAVETFILLFAFYAVFDGVMTIAAAIRNRTERNWWIHLLEGIVSIIAGVIAFLFPALALQTGVYFIAAWAIITGVLEIWAAIELRKQIEGELLLGITGVLSILFGIFMILQPIAGILTVLTIIAAYSIIFGVLMIMLAFRLRGQGDTTPTQTTSLSGA